MAQDMFRPPVHRSMKILDRAVFKKRIPLSAARVLDTQNVSKLRTELDRSKDILVLPRYQNVKPDLSPDGDGKRCILLRPEINEKGQSWPWSPKVKELENASLIKVIPYPIDLDYNYWSYADLAEAILPIAEDQDFPTGFQVVGHVAHLNLRDQFLPYKHLIGQLILDKNPGIKTVINKIDDVGEENEYRTFNYELLAGVDDMKVQLREQDCTFKFNYSKVYWNSRLNTEHERMVSLFGEGEAVCDVMAGIGPFAIPAGKRRVFVWANDKNPESHKHLVDGIARNKVDKFVRAFNEDGHSFIKTAAADLARQEKVVSIELPGQRDPSGQKKTTSQEKTFREPKVFSHYVMNLPASAMDFLPDFVGLYSNDQHQALGPDLKPPMVHCYCFDTKSDDNVEQTNRICEEISRRIGFQITSQTPETTIWDVRDVAPKKRMFCASFRLPHEVAYRKGGG